MNFFKSKTINFGVLVTLLGAVQTFLPSVQAVLSPDMYGLMTAAIGTAIIALRMVTDKPVSEK